jgi:hypothetical protein
MPTGRSNSDLAGRALGMMRWLAPRDADGTPLSGEVHGIVDQTTAVKALAQLFAVVDEALREGLLPQDRGEHAMLMLMVVREHLLSIPDPPGDERLFRQDLQRLVDALDATESGS